MLLQIEKPKESERTSKETSESFPEIIYDKEHALVLGVVLQQMHINKGLKKFGSRVKAAGKKK